MRLFTLNTDTGKVVPGVQLAEFDLGGITEPSLTPQAGMLLLKGGERRLLPISASRPPPHVNGTLVEAELGLACVAQEWFTGKGPETYHVLGGQLRANMQTVIAIPLDPERRAQVQILRFPERGAPVWTDHLPLSVTPAPASSGESLALGPAYVLHELQHHDSFREGWGFTPRPPDHPPADILRVTVGDRDWVMELRPKKNVPCVATNYDRWVRRMGRVSDMEDRALSNSIL